MSINGVRVRALLCVVLLAVVTVVSALPFDNTYAAQITSRSLTLKQHAGTTTGGSAANAVADHAFSFSVPSSTAAKSIGFQYCTTPDPAPASCTTPTGLSTTGGGVSVTGLSAAISTWTLTKTTNGAPYISSASGVNLSSATVTATIAGVTNPSTANQTFYVRITTYQNADGATNPIDTGSVAASTTNTIIVSGYNPEYLQFCTGDTVTVNCGSITNNTVLFNQDFSPSGPAAATSQMAAATNAASGYSIVATGTTLTSGSNTIPAIGTTAAASTPGGTSEFGINLAANTTTTSTPAKGAVPSPASNTTTLRANPTAAYSTPDSFALDLTGASAIANSDNGSAGTSHPTNSQVYTVTYMADVSGIQPPGTYQATINYVCTPNF